MTSVGTKIKTFFEDVGGWLKKFFTNSTVEQQVLATVRYMAPIVDGLVTVFAGAGAGAAVTAVLSQIQSSLASIASLASGAASAASGVNTQTAILNELSLLKTNLGQIMSLADIKDAATQQKVSGFVDTLVGEVEAAIEGLGGASAPPAPSAPPATASA